MTVHPPPAFILDRFSSPKSRALFTRLFLALAILAVLYEAASFFSDFLRLPFELERLPVFGVLLIMSAFFVLFAYGEFYYRSHLKPLFADVGNAKHIEIGTEIARTYSYMGMRFDAEIPVCKLLLAFERTLFFKLVLLRLGINRGEFHECASLERIENPLQPSDLFKADGVQVSAADLLLIVAEKDEALKEFLFVREIKPEIFHGAARWVEEEIEKDNKKMQWWTRDNLGRIPGIGKDLGYGYTYNLNQYSHEVNVSTTRFAREARIEEIEAIENILSRSHEANVLLVGEPGAGKHTVVEGLAELIYEGRVKPTLEHKKIIMLDGPSITARASSKSIYEGVMITILNEASSAGNIILVIENFAGFLDSAHELGADLLGIFESYISGSNMQVIALADPASFHRILEPNGLIMKLFEKVDLRDVEAPKVVRMLEDASRLIEAVSGNIFTYQSLVRAEELARRFITEGAMPEKAIDLMDDASSRLANDQHIIYPNDIDAVVERRTSIPTTTAEKDEKNTLLNLESLLHEKIINQKRAVSVISDALRRSRAGLRKGGRPVGTFLFLGPTGVGKTETAKAIAEIYFGGVDAMQRFDMSEFQGGDGMKKLIGSFDSTEPGVLAVRLREHPYSLLLFDEFEKASREVHNLFLQILDEGIFSDSMGRKVSARETMIIVTSNAGANQIWDLIKEGKDPSEVQDSVVDSIRTEGKLLPELLNRFDAIVVFHPLTSEQLEQVAMLLLRDLATRLEKQDVHFVPSRELAHRVAEIGYDPTFGARPMRRAIQNNVEQLIAKKLLDGSLKRGDSFSLTGEDINNL
jgi:ATP-dependent Clp protease ATP-binding subunit ClpC